MANSDAAEVRGRRAQEEMGIIHIADLTELRWNQMGDMAREKVEGSGSQAGSRAFGGPRHAAQDAAVHRNEAARDALPLQSGSRARDDRGALSRVRFHSGVRAEAKSAGRGRC